MKFIRKNGRVIPIRDGGSHTAALPAKASVKQHIKHLTEYSEGMQSGGAVATAGSIISIGAGIASSAYNSKANSLAKYASHFKNPTAARGIGDRVFKAAQMSKTLGYVAAGGTALLAAGVIKSLSNENQARKYIRSMPEKDRIAVRKKIYGY